MSPKVDRAYRANNFWLDRFGFYFKEDTSIARYFKWVVVFYLILDWNALQQCPVVHVDRIFVIVRRRLVLAWSFIWSTTRPSVG